MRRVLGWTIRVLLKVLATAVVVAVPVLGVWAGTSLAAYQNGPVWVAIVAGVVMFPVLPLVWDGWAQWRRSRKGEPAKRILTFWDRVVVRTFVLNLAFLAAFLALWPQTIFTAVSTRGDWMLEEWQDETGEEVREEVLAFADRLSWLYEASQDNPYEEMGESSERPRPTPAPNEGRRSDGASPTTGEPTLQEPGEELSEAAAANEARTWPQPARLHPLVRNMPVERATSVEGVGRYIADNEDDPFLRVKALHDFVADRVAYDAPAYAAGQYPPQDAETVFRTGKAVCAGYAQLMVALGDAAGIEVVYVVGDARVKDSVTGESHAWNAVKIEGEWYLVDVTWDAGHVDGSRFTKRYRTANLFTPPEVFGLSHFPNDEEWQLREQPLTRGEFFRQPMLRPEFYAHGLSLVSPTRSQVDVDDRVEVLVDNPRSRFMLAKYRPRTPRLEASSSGEGDCRVDNGRRAKILCDFPRPGRWEVLLFDGPERYGQYGSVGSIDVNSR